MVVFYEVIADFTEVTGLYGADSSAPSALADATAAPSAGGQVIAGVCPGPGPACAGCDDKLICHCLQVYESTLIDAVDSRQMMTVNDIIRETGAGGGCTACHRRLRRFLKTTI